jgi:hypothetical protein
MMMLITAAPTPPVVDHILSTRDNIDDTHQTVLEKLLVHSLFDTPSARGLIQNHEELRHAIELYSPELVSEGSVNKESAKQAIRDIDPERGVTDEFAAALDNAR